MKSDTYRPRVVDAELARLLAHSGAVLIEGPKACGKTETARQIAASQARLDVDPHVRLAMELDPALVLQGQTPRLLDEWQEFPQVWNHVRRAVDDRGRPGQFILTGSANPDQSTRLHSGAGRINRLRMRPMTLSELGHSLNSVSLGALLRGEHPSSAAVASDPREIAELVCRGGWPGHLSMSPTQALAQVRGYLDLLVEVDIARVEGTRRDPTGMRRLLQSLARNVTTPASVSSLATDVSGEDGPLARNTVTAYVDALTRLMVVEDQPAWSTHLRSSATLRKAAKRHFVDPSLAVAALRSSPQALLRDLQLLGLLFESMAVRDLRVYAQTHDAQVFHYRDSTNLEVDAIVQTASGAWSAFEVKLGSGAIPVAEKSLLRLAKVVDTRHVGKPQSLTVITGWGYTLRLPSGVNVVPLTALGV